MSTKAKFSVRLECEHSSGPGLWWFAAVEFRSLKRGFSVWDTDPDDNNFRRLRKISQSSDTLTWREVGSWLLSYDGGLGGAELLETIYISSPFTEAQDDLVMACWIRWDCPIEEERHKLLGLKDEDLEYLWSAHKSLCSADAIEFLQNFFEVLESIEREPIDIGQIAAVAGFNARPHPTVLLERLWILSDELADEKRLQNLISIAVDGLRRWDKLADCNPKLTEQRACELEAFLRDWIAKHNSFPGDSEQVPGLGRVTIHELISPLERFLREEPDYLLGTALLEQCARMDPPQKDSSLIRLFESWLASETKPLREQEPVRDFLGSRAAAFVEWMVLENLSSAMGILASVNPEGLTTLVTFIVEADRRAESAEFRGPGVAMAAIGRMRFEKRKQRWKSFFLRFRTAAKGVLDV